MGFYSMMFVGMAPFGGLLAGVIANFLGAPLAVTIGGIACIVGAFVFRAYLPMIRAEGRQMILAQMATAGNPLDREAPNIST